jgi:hypothetical protein
MNPGPRHQCLIYDGAPSRQLPAIASVICEKLGQNHRCLYLNSRPMVAGLRSQLAAQGLDVKQETATGRLMMSAEQTHLLGDWEFDVPSMLGTLERALQQALSDGYQGLWATGDMTWEFGPAKDLSKLLEYEWRLEEFMREHPEMGGICQYHADLLPRDVLRKGLQAHSHLFVNETLSMINPHYLDRASFSDAPNAVAGLDRFMDRVLDREPVSEA